jgi:hypothetical protein
MKTLKLLLLAFIPLLFHACSEDTMDEINRDLNNALEMSAQSILPDAILKSAFETTGTDIAWYATVYIEHSAGTWGQSVDADKRIGQTAASLFNNNWNSLYDLLNELRVMIEKTSPGGEEESNTFVLGVAHILTAYNLAVLTDMWGEVPWTEALKGSENLQPSYDKQSGIYPKIIQLLDDAITVLNATTTSSGVGDYIYGGDVDSWIRAAYSLKARYWLRLSEVDANALGNALTALANGFTSADEQMLFDAFEATSSGENPWYQFLNDRTHLSVSQTLYNMMDARNDPRIDAWFSLIDGAIVPAPSGTATQSQGGVYSQSLQTENGRTAPTPMMTYHELKFIEAEAKFRTGDGTWQAALQNAIEANFAYHGIAGGTDYFTDEVIPLLTAGNELNEILTQKYIGFYEFEAIEAYNDYRRYPGFLTLNNPNNATTGFVWRFPYPVSEVSSNSANVPGISVFQDKVWWAGGTEKL